MVPALILLGLNFVGHLGVLYIILAVVLLASGGMIVRSERKRLAAVPPSD